MTFLIDDLELSVEKRGPLAVVMLKRPENLNALSLEMIRLLSVALDKIEQDDTIKTAALLGEGDRAFCAGGDVKLASKLGMAYRRGEISEHVADLYFREEYSLDQKLYHFKKPVITFMDGITMGGGAGLALPSAFRVITPRTVFAMPEVKLGFFPDVGGTYHLQKWPDSTGLLIALSGYNIKDLSDLLYLGIGTHIMTSLSIEPCLKDMEKVLENIPQNECKGVIPDILGKYVEDYGDAGLIEKNMESIENLMGHESFDDIYEASHEDSNDFTREISMLFNKASPLSLKVTYEYYKLNKGQELDMVINRDMLLVRHFVDGLDFYEGIRAVLWDKNEPAWSPSRLSDVTQDMVEEYLAEVRVMRKPDIL